MPTINVFNVLASNSTEFLEAAKLSSVFAAVEILSVHYLFVKLKKTARTQIIVLLQTN